MSVLRYRASNHPQQTRVRGPIPEIDDRATSPEVFDPLNERFGFTLDVAASSLNAKCSRYYSIDEDGLSRSWVNSRVWCNPPYSNIRPWVEKAWDEWTGHLAQPDVIVMLVPASRAEQGWWQDLVEPHRDRPGSPLKTEFLRGRLRFIRRGATEIGPNERPPFGCVLLIWDWRDREEAL